MTKLRIVSLVPSLTRTLVDAGFKDSIVGCTKFCVSPKGLWKTKTLVGGTKDPDLAIIRSLNPSHILTNDEENRAQDIADLEREWRVVRTFPKTAPEVLTMFTELEAVLGGDGFTRLKHALKSVLSSPSAGFNLGPTYLYLIWKNPYMVAGTDTYIHNLFNTIGLRHALPNSESRYPTVTATELRSLNPKLVLLASEPYPFRLRDAAKLRQELGETDSRLYKVDGQLLSWWGSMTAEALTQLAHWRAQGLASTKCFREWNGF